MKLKNKEQKAFYKMLCTIRDYSVFMDNYFSNQENIEKNPEINTAYKEYSKDIINSLTTLGVVKNGK